MAEERAHRRLAAILAADVVGYSRLMQLDEAGTLAALKARRSEVLQPVVSKHSGRIVKLMGDGVLIEFASAVDAVECAVQLQQAMQSANASVPEERRIVLRIGINLGDVIVEGSDLYGDGVNVAARLESIAEPGYIYLAQTVVSHVRGKIPHAFEDLGERNLKNLAEPVRVYRVSRANADMGAAAPNQPAALSKPSVAVLPFTNMSGDPEQEYFSDGITEDIITELSRFRALFVIARHSSFQYRGPNVDVKRVGRELGVQFVLEGSVRKIGDRMRVTAQLIDALTGKHTWAERYDREMRDLLVLQDEIVRAVASTVGGRIDAAGRDRTVQLSPAGLASYDLLLRARALFLKSTRSDVQKAGSLVQKAIELDPNNAQLYAHQALFCWYEYSCDWTTDPGQTIKDALDFAKRAVTLDDADSTARWVLSLIYLVMHNFAEGRPHIERAVELNPNDSEARGVYGYFLTCAGEPDKALEQFEIASRNNPFDLAWLPWVKGQAYFGLRRYEEAIATFNQAYQTNNEVNAWLAASYALAGRMAEAKVKLQEYLRTAEREMVHFPGEQAEEWMRYLRRAFSYKNPADLEHLSAGLREAGLPV